MLWECLNHGSEGELREYLRNRPCKIAGLRIEAVLVTVHIWVGGIIHILMWWSALLNQS